MRKEDTHRSEMVSQLLFGEPAQVLEKGKAFTRIRCVYDGYEGWCQSAQLEPVAPASVDAFCPLISSEWENRAEIRGQSMHLSLGTSLGIFRESLTGVTTGMRYLGKTWDAGKAVFSEENIRHFATEFINTPYLWGGRSVYGIDCSGFVQQLFRFFAIQLPRDACQQAAEGEIIGFLQEARCGDLAYFDNEERRITHVGLLLSADTIVHASGKVRIDRIDNMGILNTDTGERTHQLRIIRRYRY